MTEPRQTTTSQPLADRVRPRSNEQICGQSSIWGPKAPLRRLVEAGRLYAVILWGPPGTGKTTLARLIGDQLDTPVAEMSAVRHGVKQIREQIGRSEIRINHGESAILLFMDEIHRLNKAQQDILLPALEQGIIRFCGATTENPSFEVNAAILSRCLVFQLTPLQSDDIVAILRNALTDPRGQLEHRQITEECLTALAEASQGDARSALNLMEAALACVPEDQPLDVPTAREFLGSILQKYDKSADYHYDVASALIKSIRASQPDAALYYLARMIDAGEDPMFIARRLVIAASEDIGNANPTALLVATSGMDAVHKTGYPEARIILGQMTTYLSASPKSNRSYVGIEKALADVKKTGALPVPMALRNAPTQLMKQMGYSKGYVYAHDDPKKAAKMSYLPEELGQRIYYEPLEIGTEKQLKANLEQLRRMATNRPDDRPSTSS